MVSISALVTNKPSGLQVETIVLDQRRKCKGGSQPFDWLGEAGQF